MLKKIYYRLLYAFTKGFIRQDVKRALVCASCTEVFQDFERHDFARNKNGEIYCTECGCYSVYNSATGEMVNKRITSNTIQLPLALPEGDTSFVARKISEIERDASYYRAFMDGTNLTVERYVLSELRSLRQNFSAYQQKILERLIVDTYDISTPNYRRVKRREVGDRKRYWRHLRELHSEYEQRTNYFIG